MNPRFSTYELQLNSSVLTTLNGNFFVDGVQQLSILDGSGYLPTGSLAPYALQTSLNATGTGLQAQIATLNGQSGTWYLKTNPSGYLSTIPSDVVRTTGIQTISGQKSFSAMSLFPSGASGVFYGNGSGLTGLIPSNTVFKTGTQTISGNKTFVATIFAPEIDSTNGSGIVSLNGPTFVGPWTLDSSYGINGNWTASATMTKYTPAIAGSDPTPATVTITGIPWGSITDGEFVTLNIDGIGADFTFRESPSESNDVQINDGDDNGTVANLATAISTAYSGSATAGSSGSDLIITTTDTGTSASISINGTGATTSSVSGSDNGSDGTSGTPASGTTYYQLTVPVSNRSFIITEIVASVASPNWSAADIEIGYGLDYTNGNFQRSLFYPRASINTTGVHLLSKDIIPTSFTEGRLWLSGISNTSMWIRTTSTGLYTTNEQAGGDVSLYFRGIYI